MWSMFRYVVMRRRGSIHLVTEDQKFSKGRTRAVLSIRSGIRTESSIKSVTTEVVAEYTMSVEVE